VSDFEFNLNDVTNLAGKLGALKPDLTPKEYNLLLVIFAAAAARAEVTDPVARTSTLPNAQILGQTAGTGDPGVTLGDLKKQLLNAYIPGTSFAAVEAESEKNVAKHGG
jgi:hypothetical protein